MEAKLIVKRETKDDTPLSVSVSLSLSPAFLHYSPELFALRFVAPNRLHGSEHPSMSDEASHSAS